MYVYTYMYIFGLYEKICRYVQFVYNYIFLSFVFPYFLQNFCNITVPNIVDEI
jgi:hypothetical protein